MNDQAILALLFSRAEEALDALARKFGSGLLKLARQILTSPEDAEEAVNDTYLALWNAIPPARPEPLAPYVYRVCRNQALKRRERNLAGKRCGLTVSVEELRGTLSGPSLEETVSARALGRAVDAFLDTQSKTNRILFLRRYWFGDSVRDIARVLGMTENAVSVRLLRTRTKLKEYLIKEGLYYE